MKIAAKKNLLEALLTLYEIFVRFGENLPQETPIKMDGATAGFVKTGAVTGHTWLAAGNEFLTVQYLFLLSDKNTTI